eukprot:6447511-Amphidinium_carterae.1
MGHRKEFGSVNRPCLPKPSVQTVPTLGRWIMIAGTRGAKGASHAVSHMQASYHHPPEVQLVAFLCTNLAICRGCVPGHPALPCSGHKGLSHINSTPSAVVPLVGAAKRLGAEAGFQASKVRQVALEQRQLGGPTLSATRLRSPSEPVRQQNPQNPK